jgi:hypothetical protein
MTTRVGGKPTQGKRKKAAFHAKAAFVQFGSPARTRTTDKVVNSHLLYRLSYWGMRIVLIAYPASMVNILLYKWMQLFRQGGDS